MGRRAVGLCIVIVVLQPISPSARLPAQQVAPNRSTAYLFPTDVQDVRALWVNPAGLGVQREASTYAELLVSDPGALGQLSQINAGFNARGLSIGYQRDNLDDGVRGHTYRLGLAGGSGGLAVGGAIALYRGSDAKSMGWDIGMMYTVHHTLNAALVFANIGQPVVRGLQQRMTYIPGVTWTPVAGLGFSTDARITPDSIASFAFGLSWRSGSPGKWPIEVITRLDTDGGLRRGAFVFGLSLGRLDRFGAIGTTPGDVSRVDGVSLYGLAVREPTTRRP